MPKPILDFNYKNVLMGLFVVFALVLWLVRYIEQGTTQLMPGESMRKLYAATEATEQKEELLRDSTREGEMRTVVFEDDSALPQNRSLQPILAPDVLAEINSRAGTAGRTRPPDLPLVFETVDPKQLDLTDRQSNDLEALRSEFIAEIGGVDQNPNDPAYVERWLKALRIIDGRMEAMLGERFCESYRAAVR